MEITSIFKHALMISFFVFGRTKGDGVEITRL
jgi:hypothetical protein